MKFSYYLRLFFVLISLLTFKPLKAESLKTLKEIKATEKCENIGCAVLTHNKKLVEDFLKNKADPNFKFANEPVLAEALTWGLVDIGQLLLDAGANPNEKTSNGSPLILRLGSGHGSTDENLLKIAKLLAEHKANFDVKDSSNFSLIDSMIMKKLPKTLDFILLHSSKTNISDSLEKAAEYGNFDIFESLLKKGANPNQKNIVWKIMHYRPDDQQLKIIKLKAVDKTCGYWVQMASMEGRIEVVKELVKLGFNLDAADEGNRTALMLAIENNKNEIVKILLSAKVKTEITSQSGYGSFHGETAICLASRKGNLEAVNELISAKADVNANCGSVEQATKIGSIEIVKSLIKAGADLKDRYTGHWKSLFIAAELNNKEIAQLLISGGVRIDVRNEDDSTPLMIAASKGSLDSIRLLVKNGANLMATNARRPITDVGTNFIGTPLQWAIEYKQNAAASLLRELGAEK